MWIGVASCGYSHSKTIRGTDLGDIFKWEAWDSRVSSSTMRCPRHLCSIPFCQRPVPSGIRGKQESHFLPQNVTFTHCTDLNSALICNIWMLSTYVSHCLRLF